MYSAVVLIRVCKPLVYCESLSLGVHAQTNDHMEGRFHTTYKSSIRVRVQTARGLLQFAVQIVEALDLTLPSCLG